MNLVTIGKRLASLAARRAAHAAGRTEADLTPDESTRWRRGCGGGVEHWRGRRWWRMHELQPPGAVYQHQGQGAVQSERAQQASASISGLTASARARTKGKDEAGEG
jgi:hypothetical protein